MFSFLVDINTYDGESEPDFNDNVEELCNWINDDDIVYEAVRNYFDEDIEKDWNSIELPF